MYNINVMVIQKGSNVMKNKKLILLSISAAVLLGACNDQKETENKPEPSKPQLEEVKVPALSDEQEYTQIHNKLSAAGFTVSEPQAADPELFGAESGMVLEINGEPLLPLHIYKLSSTDERLPVVSRTGYIDVADDMKKERIRAIRQNQFVMHLHKAHPDYEAIMDVLSE